MRWGLMRVTGAARTMAAPIAMRTRRIGQDVTAPRSLLSARYSTSMTPAMLTTTPTPTVTANPCPANRSATAIPGMGARVIAG